LDPLGLWDWGVFWGVVATVGVVAGGVALAFTGIGLVADAGLLTGLLAAETIEDLSVFAGGMALWSGAVGVASDAAACVGNNDSNACAGAVLNATGEGIAGAGVYAGRSGYPGAKGLGIGATIGSLPETGWGYGLDLKGFEESCKKSSEEGK
jgi:hypothetical protein